MIQYVYQSCRRVKGKRVRARSWSGRYAVSPGDKIVTVGLYTTDKRIAEKRLRDIVVTAQREREGIIPSSAQREAARSTLQSLLADYRSDLCGRGLKTGHVKETIARILRVVVAKAWTKLSDVTPSSFVSYRASLIKLSAKTRKEYQTSVNAFLNWCVKTDRLSVNPLAKIDRVDIRGKQVRPSRSFTVVELESLFRVSAHALFYQTLLYTGQRRGEIAGIVWGDLDFPTNTLLVREGTTKDKDKRAVPLHPMLATQLIRAKPLAAEPGDLVFPTAPSYETLMGDFVRASIERRDSLGRVVHFPAFRKTFQTMGVRAGVGQRSAQAILGHSDPSLTANVYTDVAALHLHAEVAKLPWVGHLENAALRAQKCGQVCVTRSLADIVAELVEAAKSLSSGRLPSEDMHLEVAARHGFEP